VSARTVNQQEGPSFIYTLDMQIRPAGVGHSLFSLSVRQDLHMYGMYETQAWHIPLFVNSFMFFSHLLAPCTHSFTNCSLPTLPTLPTMTTFSIPLKMWLITLLVSLPAFLYGYVTASLNAAMITGDEDSSPASCFHRSDEHEHEDGGGGGDCPPGSIYNDILLTTCKSRAVLVYILVQCSVAVLW
jgi:hypothetical protein